jgi:hypothetical protein
MRERKQSARSPGFLKIQDFWAKSSKASTSPRRREKIRKLLRGEVGTYRLRRKQRL